MMRRLLLLFIMLAPALAFCQRVKVRAGFLSDSIRVGDEVLFYVTALYPKSQQLIFPDTTFSYKPFEFSTKSYFPTQRKDTLHYDSAVYALKTFEVERYQSLRLPVFIINALDCTSVFSNRDTILLQQLIKSLPDSVNSDLPLKASTAYQEVPREINYPLIIITVSLAGIVAGIGWVGFGPSLKKRYKRRRLEKSHKEFMEAYNRHLEEVRQRFSPGVTESAVNVWKKYMEKITARPYTKLTTRETATIEPDEVLSKDLYVIDSAIYGHNTEVTNSLESLKIIADQRFNNVLKEVENG